MKFQIVHNLPGNGGKFIFVDGVAAAVSVVQIA